MSAVLSCCLERLKQHSMRQPSVLKLSVVYVVVGFAASTL